MAALREELKTAQDRLLKMSKEEEDSIEKVLGIKVCTSKEEFYKNSQIGILKWVSFKFQSKASPVDNSIVWLVIPEGQITYLKKWLALTLKDKMKNNTVLRTRENNDENEIKNWQFLKMFNMLPIRKSDYQ